jgi:hypothetical protein
MRRKAAVLRTLVPGFARLIPEPAIRKRGCGQQTTLLRLNSRTTVTAEPGQHRMSARAILERLAPNHACHLSPLASKLTS